MNLEDKGTVDICQGKSSNNAAEKTPSIARSEFFLSPTRRSSRIRKPKVSNDYCNIDDAIEANKTTPKNIESSKEKSSCSVIGTSSRENFIDNEDNELSRKSLEKNNSFFQMDSDEEESFESMFDDIFGQRYSKTVQSLLPKKLNSESVKERKFFKRNTLESPKPNFSKGYVGNKSNLPTEDVDKVFKIISKPNILSDIPSDSKTSGKPSLKTYCNKRKSFNQNNIVESFGLPDYPIVSENVIKPMLNNKLDAEILDASEITILDLQFVNESWTARNMEDESVFPFHEEVRIKEEPVKHERFRKNSSFLDPNYFENFDLCNDFNIYTSTPEKLVNDKILDTIKCASLNDTSTDKDIDIEAIKNNFKKLNKTFDDNSPSNEEMKEEVRVKVKRNISPKKKTGSVESKHNISISTEISFIETDSLTVENKEFEISSNLPVPKKIENNSANSYKCENTSSKLVSSLGYSKTDCGYSNSHTKAMATKESKIIRRRLKASSIYHPLKSQQQLTQEKRVKKEYLSVHQSSPHTAKKVLKSKTHKNEIAVENEAYKIDIKGKLPKKKTVETDFVLAHSKRSLKSLLSNEEQCLEEQDKIVRCNEESEVIGFNFHDTNNDNKKRTLRSSLNNSHDLQSSKPSTNLNEKTCNLGGNSELININADNGLGQECTNEQLLNSIIKTKTEQLETLKKSLGSNINLPREQNLTKTTLKMNEQTEKKTNIFPSNFIVTSKRILRSASQENLGKDVQEANTTSEEKTESTVRNTSWNYLNGESKTRVKISLEKLKFETDINVSKINNQENAPSGQKNDRKDKGPKSIKTIVNREIHLQPEIVLRKCNMVSNLSSNYDEIFAEEEMLSPLKKGKKSIPEIRIIISPLDASFVSRASEIMSDSFNKLDIMSPTKRKLRSTKALIDSMNTEKKSIDDPEKEHGKSPLKSKTVSKNIDPDEILHKENSPKIILNSVQMEPINNTVPESDPNSLNKLPNKDQEMDENVSSKLEVKHVTLENEECIKQIVPKVRTPRKSKGLSTSKTLPKDFDKSVRGNCIPANKFKTIINNCNNGLFGDSTNELEGSNFKGTKKDTSEFNKQCNSSLKYLQNQSASKISETDTSKTTLLRNTEADLNDCEITAALSKSKNVICDDSDNIVDKICQEFNFNRLQIENVMDITASKSMKMSNNLKIDLPKESKFLAENDDTTIDGMEHEKELIKNAVFIDKQKNETAESSLKLENTFTTDNHNKSVELKNGEKDSETYRKEESIHQLHKSATPRNEQWKAHLISNKLVAIKIIPSNTNTNNYLLENDEKKIQQKIPDLVPKELTKEKINSITSQVDSILNNVSLDLEVDSLNEIADNTIEFNKLNCIKSSVPIISNTEKEELIMNCSDEPLDSLKNINMIGTQLGVDDNAVDKGETEEQLIENNMTVSDENRKVKDISSNFDATITECDVEINPESKDDYLEITEVFDKVINENREFENSVSIKNNNLSNTNESISNSSIDFDCDNSEEKKQTDVVVTVSKTNDVTSICNDLLMNVGNTKKGRNNKLLNKSAESKRPKQKSIKKVENAPQLKKEKLKSLAGKTSSSILETSPKTTGNNCINEVIEPAKCSQFVDYLEHNDNMEINTSAKDITSNRISRRSAFNRKLTTENVLPKRENTKTNGDDKCKSNKPSRRKRRKSINDIDLQDIEREQYRCRLRRSKSVAPSTLESKKKLYDRDDRKTEIVDVCVDHVISFDSEVEEQTEYKLKRSKSFSEGTLLSRSRNVAISNDTLKKNKEKLIDKKKSRDIKGSKSKGTNGKITTEENKDINREDEDIQFQVGDLAWAQIGSHPFWPCLVTEEPETVCHIKKMNFQGKRSQKIFYHVHFFGDKGRRAWINKHQIMLYSNRNDLSELSDKMKIKNNSPMLQQAYIIKPHKLKKWERAVDEAELLKTKSVDEKMSFFIDMFAPRAKKKQTQLLVDDNVCATNEPLVNQKRKNKVVKNEGELELSSNTDNTDEKSPIDIVCATNEPLVNRKGKKKTVKNGEELELASNADNTDDESPIDNVCATNEPLVNRKRKKKAVKNGEELELASNADNTDDESPIDNVCATNEPLVNRKRKKKTVKNGEELELSSNTDNTDEKSPTDNVCTTNEPLVNGKRKKKAVKNGEELELASNADNTDDESPIDNVCATNEPLVNRKRKKKAVKNGEGLELSSNTDNTDEKSPIDNVCTTNEPLVNRKRKKKAVKNGEELELASNADNTDEESPIDNVCAINEPLVNRKRKKKAVKNGEELELSSNTDNTDEKSPIDNVFATNEPLVNRKRKRKAVKNEAELELSSNTDEKSPIRKKFKKAISSGTTADDESISADMSKNEIEIDNLNKIENTEILQNENKLSCRLRLRKQVDEISEIDSKTSSDNITDTTLYSMASQKALFKRNNLFKGVSRDKVCQYCYKPETVLKCRGRCNGPYHIECATKILQEKFYRKKKVRNTNNNLVQDAESVHKSKIISKEDKNTKEAEMIDFPKHDINKFGLLEDDHVQIITVPSSVYNTPPRKTFPPNFKNMSLAEQIDYKMKEIMKKFESKTVYSESTDSSSEENSLIQPLPKVTNFSRCESLYPNNSTFDKESNVNSAQVLQENEVTKIDHLTDKPSTLPTVEKLIDNNNSNGKSENNSKTIKSKHFIAHVTADFESLNSSKSDIIQEDNLDFTESVDIIDNTVNPKNFKCGFCISDLDPFCFICNLAISKRGSSIRQKCSLYQCGRFYHPDCLKMWPQTQWSLIQTTKHKDSDEAVDSFVCPLHVCHTCASDDPRAATSRCSGDKIVKCLRCPSTYHSTNYCVPAGTTILSSTQIICPRHRDKNKLYTINTTWCFLCSEGGNLICCETCPTSVHPECLPVNLTDDDKFICEDCESGRLPLYDEIVWVKLGKFRWWPALILFPNEVPDNIMNIKHATGEFVVKFFGTYDYYWVNRGRSFLFQDGDTGHCNSIKKKVDAAFNKAVEEAVVAHKSKKEFKRSQEAESISSLKPPPYIRIKVNKPVGNVRQLDLDLSSTNACECDPSQPNPCGPDSDCLNRLLLTECSPDVCPAGTRCKNQSFDKREYPPLVPYKTQGRGWGLKTLAPIKKGQFVIEYVGEMIDIEEYQRRIQKMHEQKEENYYFLTIDKDRMLDAGPKGNVARFMNHCCQPNCETQKWTVNGDTRVGLFATNDISADTELTFNYNLECVGKEKKVCRCGAPNCSGFIGVKAKQDTDSKKPKKSYKKKKPEEPIILPPCFICGRKGNVGACNNKICNNAYHLKCLKIMEWPEGNKFICPWHNCNICSKRTIRCCVKCVNSFCPSHSEGNVRYDNLLGFVCNNHDPIKVPNDEEPLKLRKKKNSEITEETAVTSTTSDDLEDEDSMPLTQRKIKNKRKKREVMVESDSDNDFVVNKTLTSSTSFKKQEDYSDYESQDEGTVSSATMTDVEENIIVKRKRGRPRKGEQMQKILKLNNVQSHESTASFSLLKDDNNLRNNGNNCELSISHNELENR